MRFWKAGWAETPATAVRAVKRAAASILKKVERVWLRESCCRCRYQEPA
jgi:hypothetical protein